MSLDCLLILESPPSLKATKNETLIGEKDENYFGGVWMVNGHSCSLLFGEYSHSIHVIPVL